MKRTVSWLAGFMLLMAFVAACSRPENKLPAAPPASPTGAPNASVNEGGPPADVVQASATKVEMSVGSSAEAIVNIKIAPGYHINGNPSSKFQIATALEVAAIGGITAGKPIYPPSISKKFSFSPESIMVYEKEAIIKQPLRADANAAKGSLTLDAKLRIQPCDETVCYPPRTLGVSIPVNVK